MEQKTLEEITDSTGHINVQEAERIINSDWNSPEAQLYRWKKHMWKSWNSVPMDSPAVEVVMRASRSAGQSAVKAALAARESRLAEEARREEAYRQAHTQEWPTRKRLLFDRFLAGVGIICGIITLLRLFRVM